MNKRDKIRLFVGIMASDELKEYVNQWRSTRADWPGRWIAPHNLHLTLFPPFYDDPTAIVNLLSPLAIEFSEFKINYKSVELGPNPRQARLVWARGSESADLAELKSRVDSTLGGQPVRRKLLPHLTLARLRPYDSEALKTKHLPDMVAWPEIIKSFELIEAILRPSGAEYRVIESFRLKE